MLEDKDNGPLAHYLDRFISKYNEPWFVFFNIALLWIALIAALYAYDLKMEAMADFLNQELRRNVFIPSYDSSAFNYTDVVID